jgi:hypothetical protein
LDRATDDVEPEYPGDIAVTNTIKTVGRACRIATAEEVDHFREFGWVKLKRFVDPDCLQTVLGIARQKMGDDADSNADAAAYGAGGAKRTITYFNAEFGGGLQHPQMRPLIEQVAESAKLLMRRKSGAGVRYYKDLLFPKLPSTKPSRHGGNGLTDFHQDFITFAVDRTGGMTFWIPLEAYGPEAGTMSFVSRSHSLGVLGDYTTYGSDGVFGAYPELRELEMTEPLTYELGDISVHSHLTIHGAGSNMMDKPRWAYALLMQPSDVCWSGQPCPNFDSSNMKPYQPLDDERFPILA